MSTAAPFEIVQEVGSTAVTEVFRVSTPDRPDGALARKVYKTQDGGFLASKDGVAAFLDAARTQKDVAAGPGRHWAPVHQLGESEGGAFYVTTYYANSAQKLVTGKVRLGAGALYAIINGVLGGLLELRQACDRQHGNLKPSNVLISGTTDIEDAEIVLCDPADAGSPAAHDGAEDVFQVGQLIHQLVLHRPFRAVTGWPIETSPAWDRLGRCGNRWREFANHLLHPDPLARPATLEEARAELARAQRASPVVRTVILTTAAAAVITFVVAGGTLLRRHWQIQRDVKVLAEADKDGGWLKEFEGAYYAIDERQPKLLAAIAPEIVAANVGLTQIEGYYTDSTSVFDSRRAATVHTKAESVRRLEKALREWKFVSETLEPARRDFENKHWAAPAKLLSQLISGLQPGGTNRGVGETLRTIVRNHADLNEALKRIASASDGIHKGLHSIEVNSQGTRVPVLFKADAEKRAAEFADSVSEVSKLKTFADQLEDLQQKVDAFAGVLRQGWHEHLDLDRLKRGETTQAVLEDTDFGQWQRALDEYTRIEPKESYVSDLDRNLDELDSAITRVEKQNSKPVAALAQLKQKASELEVNVSKFQNGKWVRKDSADIDRGYKDLNGKILECLAKVTNLAAEARGDWLEKQWKQFEGDDPPVREAWERWLKNFHPETVSEDGYKQAMEDAVRLASNLRAIASGFDQPPVGGPAPFNEAVAARREKELAAFLNAPGRSLLDADVLSQAQAAQDRFREWSEKVRELAKNCQAATNILTSAGARASGGITLDAAESGLKAGRSVFDDSTSKPALDKANEVLALIDHEKKVAAEVAVLTSRADAKLSAGDWVGARTIYAEILKVRRDASIDARYKEIDAKVRNRIDELIDVAKGQYQKGDGKGLGDTKAELARFAPDDLSAKNYQRQIDAWLKEMAVKDLVARADDLWKKDDPQSALKLLEAEKDPLASDLAQRIRDRVREGAEQERQGSQAYARRDYPVAFDSFKAAARCGNLRAMVELARMYRDGLGVSRTSGEEVRDFLNRACGKGDFDAMRELAQLLQAQPNLRTKIDPLASLEKAAAAGNVSALVTLARMYEQGAGVRQDMAQARMYYQNAADRRSPEAVTWLNDNPERQRKRAEKMDTGEGPAGNPSPPRGGGRGRKVDNGEGFGGN